MAEIEGCALDARFENFRVDVDGTRNSPVFFQTPFGMRCAVRPSMGKYPVATRHTELIAWQLCARLRRLVLTYTRQGPARNDYRFRNDIRAAARSACYLTSEGFYRKRDGDFINFLIMARASLGEAGDQIDDGAESGYFTKQQHDEMISFVKRACGANSGLRRFLEAAREKTRPRHARRTGGPTDQRT